MIELLSRKKHSQNKSEKQKPQKQHNNVTSCEERLLGRSESGIPIWQEDYLILEKQFVAVMMAIATLIYLAPLPAASGSFWREVEAVINSR